jgi:hypothetical protein
MKIQTKQLQKRAKRLTMIYKTLHKTKDRVTRTSLNTGGELHGKLNIKQLEHKLLCNIYYSVY